MQKLSRLLDTLLAYAITLSGTPVSAALSVPDDYQLEDPEVLPPWRQTGSFRPRFA